MCNHTYPSFTGSQSPYLSFPHSVPEHNQSFPSRSSVSPQKLNCAVVSLTETPSRKNEYGFRDPIQSHGFQLIRFFGWSVWLAFNPHGGGCWSARERPRKQKLQHQQQQQHLHALGTRPSHHRVTILRPGLRLHRLRFLPVWPPW